MKFDIKNLTNLEKIDLVLGSGFWKTNTLNGKLPTVIVSDGPCGVRSCIGEDGEPAMDGYNGDKPSVSYPTVECLAQTWNPALAEATGNAIANDCIERGLDILLAPGVNIKRNPLCGRNFEYFSEDPVIAGTMARSYIKGVQDKHIGTSLKHYCANNTEFSRLWLSSEVDERTIREIYIKPFEIAMASKPWTVMCAYNLVNGVRMSENKELYGVLYDKLGFDGMIISDWTACKNPVNSVNAGLALQMPEEEGHRDILIRALNDGTLNLKALDYCASKVLELIERNEEAKPLRKIDISKEERINYALRVAEEGIVLVKNNGILPIDKSLSVMVTGRPSIEYYSGGGSSKVVRLTDYTPLDVELRGLGVNATYTESIAPSSNDYAYMADLKTCYRSSLSHDVTIVTVGDGGDIEFEKKDRQNLKLFKEEIQLIRSLRKASKKLVLVVYAGAVVDLSEFNDICDAIILASYPGEKGNLALAEIITGKVNPSGRLTETYAYDLMDYPVMHCYEDEAVACYEDGINVGYRYFLTRNKDVLYPFGYGLSYSEFNYKNVNIKYENDKVLIDLDLENTSDIDGAEVVQIYSGEITKRVYRPLRELKAFKKVFLKAHEERHIHLELTKLDLAFYSVFDHDYVCDNGFYNISINKSANEVIYNKIIEVK